jgi:hypothetical protein
MSAKTSAVAMLAALASATAAADGKFKLDDAQLDRVTAGTQSDARELMQFDFSKTTAAGRHVSGDGALTLVAPSNEYTLYLGDGAQGNLKSLVNINAINSQISVLLNLNVNIDSSVGTLNQLNIQVPVPTTAVPGEK